MATLESLKSSMLLVLGDDPDTTPDYHEDLMLDAANAAQIAVLPRVWKPATDTIAAAATSHTLPSDCFEIQAVWDETQNMFLDPAILAAGEPSASVSGNGWYEYPEGTISFYSALGADGGTLFYAATWTALTTDADTTEVPDYAITAMVLYGASYMLLSKAAANAKLGAYRTRVDSGTPEDNPVQRMSEYFLARFEFEMTNMPTLLKGAR